MFAYEKKYIILAKRKTDTEWSAWTNIDNASRIGNHLNRIKQLGYDARVDINNEVKE